MQTISVDLKTNAYPVYVGRHILSQLGGIIGRHGAHTQIAVITQKNIFDLHGAALTAGLAGQGPVHTFFVPEGEKAKSLEQTAQLYTRLLQENFDRQSLIIAFGGGVVGDLAGFVAATFLRGVDFVQVPTTLLAQVDSSVGGKVGVNHPLGKNLIGAFKQPLFVFSDVALLDTLPAAEVRCGLGEVIKYGFIANAGLFAFLEGHLNEALDKDAAVLEELVRVSVAEKAAVVAKDEKEHNLRMILNFGHTFGHALEAEFAFGGLKHGEAVILGMQCALYYNRRQGALSEDDFQRGMQLLRRVPIHFDKSQLDAPKLVQRMAWDKKVHNRRIRLVLVDTIGSCRIAEAGEVQSLEEAFAAIGA